MGNETEEIFDALLVNVPPNELPKITEVYAVLSVDDAGNEGVCGMNGMACVFATPRIIDKVVARLRAFGSNPGGRKIRVVKFSGRSLVQEFDLGEKTQ